MKQMTGMFFQKCWRLLTYLSPSNRTLLNQTTKKESQVWAPFSYSSYPEFALYCRLLLFKWKSNKKWQKFNPKNSTFPISNHFEVLKIRSSMENKSNLVKNTFTPVPQTSGFLSQCCGYNLVQLIPCVRERWNSSRWCCLTTWSIIRGNRS